MAGSYQVMEKLCAAAGIDRHHDENNGIHSPVAVSRDGNYSIEFVECLASCGTAPVCMVDDELRENVSTSGRQRAYCPTANRRSPIANRLTRASAG